MHQDYISSFLAKLYLRTPHLDFSHFQSVRSHPTLTVDIFYGDPNSRGIRNRALEEEEASKFENREYRKSWTNDHLHSLQKELQNQLRRDDHRRVNLCLSPFLPMITVIRTDNSYLWYPYGTPNLRGKESPWILVDGANNDSSLVRFLEANIGYYERTRGRSVLQNSNRPA